MAHLIGTDEAGYGPNLGPLTVTGTLWEVQDHDRDLDLYQVLKDVVSDSGSGDSNKLFVADSKKVYGSSKSLRTLETHVLAVLFAAFDRIPSGWRELVELVCDADSEFEIPAQSWLVDKQLTLPLLADVEQIRSLGDQFLTECNRQSVRLKAIRCATIFAPQFNHGIERDGNKATFLSSVTLRTARKLLDLTADDVNIGCDKHGGRSKYAGLIQEFITEEFVFVNRESLESSEYHFVESERRVLLRFNARGESFLPTALASMVSKYLREIFMELWNDFWQIEIPGIKPTKGYPQDAKRFKQQIAKKQAELGISDRSIWRNR